MNKQVHFDKITFSTFEKNNTTAKETWKIWYLEKPDLCGPLILFCQTQFNTDCVVGCLYPPDYDFIKHKFDISILEGGNSLQEITNLRMHVGDTKILTSLYYLSLNIAKIKDGMHVDATSYYDTVNHCLTVRVREDE